MKKLIRLASRASALALTQAKIVQDKLNHLYPTIEVLIVPISTQGDVDKVSPLSTIGGKGVFVKEIQQALLDNRADIAVHSLKDVTATPPEELIITGFLKPESIVDTLLSADGISLAGIKENAIIATGSLRRRALLKKLRPDLNFVEIRGNIETRIQHLQSGKCDGLMLSKVGLIRLGISNTPHYDMNPLQFYPAPGQGVIALEARRSDVDILDMLKKISDTQQVIISGVELDILKGLAFNCSIPLGSYTVLEGNSVQTSGFVQNPLTSELKEFNIHSRIKERDIHVHKIVKLCQGVLNNG